MRTKAVLAALLALALTMPALAAEKRTRIDLEGRPILGQQSAPVTIVEFLDFQ